MVRGRFVRISAVVTPIVVAVSPSATPARPAPASPIEPSRSAAASSSLAVYGVGELPLRELVECSSAIVVATPTRLGAGRGRSSLGRGMLAELAVERGIGWHAPATLQVIEEPGHHCDGLPEFTVGRRGLVFLDPADIDRADYWPANGEYSLKLLDDATLPIWIERIEALQSILRGPKTDARGAQISEWIVTTAEAPRIRREGVKSLVSDDGELLHQPPASLPRATHSAEWERLTAAHRARLVAALLATNELDTGTRALESCLSTTPDAAIDRWLVERARAKAADAPIDGPPLLDLLLRRARRGASAEAVATLAELRPTLRRKNRRPGDDRLLAERLPPLLDALSPPR